MPGEEFVLVEGVGQAEHGFRVGSLGEIGERGVAGLGGGTWRVSFEEVVFGVGDFGVLFLVVEAVVALEFRFRGWLLGWHGWIPWVFWRLGEGTSGARWQGWLWRSGFSAGRMALAGRVGRLSPGDGYEKTRPARPF